MHRHNMSHESREDFLTGPNGKPISLSNMEKYMLEKGLVPVLGSNNKVTWYSRSSYERSIKKSRMSKCFFFASACIFGALVYWYSDFVSRKPRIEREPHQNKISSIDTVRNKIMITDLETNEERLLTYFKNDSNIIAFKDSLKYSYVGDTIEFFSPVYSGRLCFNINNDNIFRFIRKFLLLYRFYGKIDKELLVYFCVLKI